MKKAGKLFFLISASIAFSSLIVSALDFESASRTLIEWIQQIFSPFLEPLVGVSQLDQYFFVRILLLILLYVIVLTVLKKIEIFKKHYGVCIVVAAAVSILGTRYMSESQFINGILLPYGTLAIAISIALPFIIYFFFIHTSIESTIGRRIAWILFAAVFFGLWLMRYADIGKMNTIYWFGVIAVLLVFIIDRKIHTYFELWNIRGLERSVNDKAILDLLDQLAQAKKHVGTPQGDRRIEEIRKQLRLLGVRKFE